VFARLMGLPTVSPEEVLRLVRAGRAHVIDVNALGSWQAAHVPGATHLDPTSFAASELPPDPSTLLVFYCSNPLCRKAPNAALRARRFGYGNVRVMSAGIKGWLNARLPVESGAHAAVSP
jgi:rhodanese-related sulfurtransferase